VKIVYKQHPLPSHPQANISAQAALAAHAQGKYFEMQEKIFANMRTLSRPKLEEYAQEIGLDMNRFRADLDSGIYKPILEQESREVVSIGATGTPANFINGRYLRGAQPYEKFKEIIDEELQWAESGNRPEFTIGKNVREVLPKQPVRRSRGPDPNKVYNIPAGNAPFKGRANAPVTILHYTDYQ
jgi:protein-disulfide isomerase